jgi:ankyrin repeat protein
MFSIDQLLIFAARAGNLDLMRERIAAGADVSYLDEHHGSALFAAIAGHQLSAVEFLITQGAELNTADAHAQGALEYSLRHSDDKITAALLRAGARLKQHSLPRFRESLSEHLRRTGVQHDFPMA